ncbi:MAG: DEAD/DEAH box helicase, partial [candidate division Zixibacteria bacterium]|nr:DEAD/DEAH box helicase [candidate division Zixibacteria bacterium]
ALTRRRKAVYVAPLKALTMQKYDHLRTVFGPLGFRVVVSTRDNRGADGLLRRGAFDIAVTVYEKWQNLLLTHLDLLTAVDLIVFDEPQLLLDPKRGPVVAHLFDTLANVAQAPRMLLLAARLPQAELLAQYLNASVQRVHRRPVELRLGVLNNGRFHFREHNSTTVGDEALPWNDHLSDTEQPAALLDTLASRGERVLVFCPSKAECHRRAQLLADRRDTTFELSDDDEWRLHSGPSLAPSLVQWLARGVGVHHADLTPHQRALVESLFTAGQVNVVFCTGTLAWGVNLPATTVFIDAQKYTTGPHAGRLVPIPLDRLEFEGMAGRAGRLGVTATTVPPKSSSHHPIGRGILWGRTPCEADLLWQTYIAPEPGHTDAAAYGAPPAFAPLQRLLNWVVAGLVRSADEADVLAERSPFGECGTIHSLSARATVGAHGCTPLPRSQKRRWIPAFAGMTNETGMTKQKWIPAFAGMTTMSRDGRTSACTERNRGAHPYKDAAAQLVNTGMLQVDASGHLVPTPRGSKTAAAGLSVASAIAITQTWETCNDFDPALWTAFLSTLPEAADARLWWSNNAPYRQSHHNGNMIASEWRRRFGEGFDESIVRRFADDPSCITAHIPNDNAQTRAMLTALVLDDWAAGTSTRHLEQDYRLPVGRLEPVADMLAWLLDAAAALAETVPDARRFVRDCHRAAFEIGHGLRADAEPLVDALGRLVPRQTLLDLIARGWSDPSTIATRRAADLAGIAPPDIVNDIVRRCREWTESHDTTHTRGHTAPRKNTKRAKEDIMSPILHLSGAPCRARMAVELAGRPLTLRLKSFKYLLALATARYLTRDGWIAKTDIEAGENQIKYLYQLRRELSQAGHTAESLIENDGNGRYRLTLPSQAIRFELSRLLEHNDWEIRSRAEQLAAAVDNAEAA